MRLVVGESRKQVSEPLREGRHLAVKVDKGHAESKVDACRVQRVACLVEVLDVAH